MSQLAHYTVNCLSDTTILVNSDIEYCFNYLIVDN